MRELRDMGPARWPPWRRLGVWEVELEVRERLEVNECGEGKVGEGWCEMKS